MQSDVDVYETPRANLGDENADNFPNTEGQRINRINFTALNLIVWVYLPIMIYMVLYKFGINLGFSDSMIGKASVTRMDPFALWYIQIPATLYIITMRVKDLGINLAWCALFIIPIINIPLFFISGKKGANRYGKPGANSSLIFKLLVWFAPIVSIALFLIANLIITSMK